MPQNQTKQSRKLGDSCVTGFLRLRSVKRQNYLSPASLPMRLPLRRAHSLVLRDVPNERSGAWSELIWPRSLPIIGKPSKPGERWRIVAQSWRPGFAALRMRRHGAG